MVIKIEIYKISKNNNHKTNLIGKTAYLILKMVKLHTYLIHQIIV